MSHQYQSVAIPDPAPAPGILCITNGQSTDRHGANKFITYLGALPNQPCSVRGRGRMVGGSGWQRASPWAGSQRAAHTCPMLDIGTHHLAVDNSWNAHHCLNNDCRYTHTHTGHASMAVYTKCIWISWKGQRESPACLPACMPVCVRMTWYLWILGIPLPCWLSN